MKGYIRRVSDGEDLTQAQARGASARLFEDATAAQIGAFLSALRSKGETEGEVAGLAEGMRAAARTIDPDHETLVDICGTGGDKYDTINVSTTSAIVAAGAGVPVAKHGNYPVSSASGIADVLEQVGAPVEAAPGAVERAIENDGIGFMPAPVFHPAMEAVIGPHRELGMRTVFNVLGPLTNPAGADAQVVGVYDSDLVGLVARVLARMDIRHALVVHGTGLDGIAVHDRTTVAEVNSDDITEYTLTPEELGVDRHDLTAVAGGEPDENARYLREVVTGTLTGAKCDIVLANAGAATYVAGKANSIPDGVELARQAIDSGRAATKLHELCAGARLEAHASD